MVYEGPHERRRRLMWEHRARSGSVRSTTWRLALLTRRPTAPHDRRAYVPHPASGQRRRCPNLIAPPRDVDPDFDLGFHLRFVRAPGGGSVRDLLISASRSRCRASTATVRCGRWPSSSASRAAPRLVMKVHHSISDGVGMNCRMMAAYGDLPHAGPVAHAISRCRRWSRRTKGVGESALDALGYERRRQVTRAMACRRAVDRVPRRSATRSTPAQELADALAAWDACCRCRSRCRRSCAGGRSLRRLDVLWRPARAETAADAARVAGGTVNDAFVAGIAGEA